MSAPRFRTETLTFLRALAHHPAADLLRLKQFLAGCERPGAFAIGSRFDFLNAPLASRELRPVETSPSGPPSN